MAGEACGCSDGEGMRRTAETCCLERKEATREALKRGDTAVANITVGGKS